MLKANTIPLGHKRTLGEKIYRDFKQNKYKYLLILPVLIFLAFFAYKPLTGLVIAFKNFRPARGIWDSKWMDPWYYHFQKFFTDPYFPRLIRNTLSISLLNTLFSFPAPIILALMLNELRSKSLKRTVQTVTYMPYFVSMVVACALVRIYCQSEGLFSQLSVALGGKPQNYMISNQHFYPIYIISGIWQYIGWNSIIYLAALSGIDQEQYEAARIDGANRFQQMFHITLPGILPTIMVLFILRMGNVLNVGFEKVLLLYSEPVYEVADVISTYVYRNGFTVATGAAQQSYSTAVDLFNGVVNVMFLLGTNYLSKKTTKLGLF